MGLRPTTAEIEEQLARAIEQSDRGGSRWPGMSYEEGVDNALRWVLGESDVAPMDDEE